MKRDPKTVFRVVSIVFSLNKDPIIFSGTIKMNLDPFETYDDKHLWDALELSNLKGFIQNADKGLMYECTEGGENLRFVLLKVI